MDNIYLFLSISFVFIYVVGRLLEKIRVPWIFSALLWGTILAFFNPFVSITSSDTFSFLAQLGMYFLLFMIGMELNLSDVKEKKCFIVKSTFVIILLEGIAGSLLIHFLFSYSWFISFLVALSFATVGEAILLPILDEFKIINTKLGQAIIGIGVIDDLIEMAILILLVIFIGAKTGSQILIILGSLLSLFVLTGLFKKFRSKGEEFRFKNIETLFFFSIFVFLLFVAIGSYAGAAPLAALLAGISLRTFAPQARTKLIENEIKLMSYGFFVPIFFIWVGATMDSSYLMRYPLAVLLVVLVSNGVKVFGSYLMGRKELGTKQSILLGIGLSVRFSTSIVIIKILLDNNLIGIDLFSVIIASSIVFKFVVPLVFSNLIVRWKISKKSLVHSILR